MSANLIAGSSLILPDGALSARPIGAHVIWRHRGRSCMGEVVGVYQTGGGRWMLQVRSFNREVRSTVGLAQVSILPREYPPTDGDAGDPS